MRSFPITNKFVLPFIFVSLSVSLISHKAIGKTQYNVKEVLQKYLLM